MIKKVTIFLLPGFVKDVYFKYYKSNELTNRFTKILSLDILVKGGMFFLYPLYIRLMSVEEYGVYGYLINIISVFSLALNFGIYLAQAKQYHDIGEEKRGEYLFSINLFLGVALSVALIAIFATHVDYGMIRFLFDKPIDYQHYRTWIILGIVNSVLSLMVYNYFMTSAQIKYYQMQNVLKLVLVNFVVIALLKWDMGDNVQVRIKYNYLIDTLILLPFLFIYLRHIRPRFNWQYVKGALYIGLPAMLSGIIGIFYSLADRKLLEQYRTHEELGIYTLGITLSGIIYLIFNAFQNSLLPFFFKEKDKVENYKRTMRATRKITLLLLGMGTAMYLLTAGLILFDVIKPEYAAILPVMPLMLLTQIIQSVSTLFANYFIYFNKNHYSVLISVISTVLNIVICLLLIPPFGMMGAVMATFIVTVAVCLINYNYARTNCLTT